MMEKLVYMKVAGQAAEDQNQIRTSSGSNLAHPWRNSSVYSGKSFLMTALFN